jgi:mannose-6-phosphate isomerase
MHPTASISREDLAHPLFFNRNRVFRVYTGGALFHELFGDEPVDGNHPEEWIASKVRALNENSTNALEGLSTVEETEVSFASLLSEFPDEMTGGQGFDVLVKALDSAVRLPAQTHPDKEFSRRHFQSEHGKTECWLILATRPGAKLYFGFKEGVSEAQLEDAVRRSEEKGDAFTGLLQEVEARAGDLWLIPARVAHAIGAGCLILEVQEPTDFTIQPERWCADYRLSDQEMYLGLPKETALACFDLSQTGAAVIERGKKTPALIEQAEGYRKEALIRYEDTPCFAVFRHRLDQTACPLNGPAVFVVTAGEGVIRSGRKERRIKKGDYFFLPLAAGKVTLATGSNLEVVECLPPRTGPRSSQTA